MESLQFMAHMSLLIRSLMANEPMEPIYMATMMVLYWWIPLDVCCPMLLDIGCCHEAHAKDLMHLLKPVDA